MHADIASSYRQPAAIVDAAESDSVVVQSQLFSFQSMNSPCREGGVVMQTGNARHRTLEAEPMPSDRIELDLRQRARERIREGRLPCITHYRTWGGRGSNEPCALCDVTIGPDEVEYEIEATQPTAPACIAFTSCVTTRGNTNAPRGAEAHAESGAALVAGLVVHVTSRPAIRRAHHDRNSGRPFRHR
jgi:hypothetical protein